MCRCLHCFLTLGMSSVCRHTFFFVCDSVQTDPITTSTWTTLDTIPRWPIFPAYSKPSMIAPASVLVTVYSIIIPMVPAMVTTYGAELFGFFSIQNASGKYAVLLPKRRVPLSCLVIQIVPQIFQQSILQRLLS